MIACYVSGKGMHASDTTHRFKTGVIRHLEGTGLGYDTRYRYYRRRFPEMAPKALAAMICDPVEYYDPDWPAYLRGLGEGADEQDAVTAFMRQRDQVFREQARVAIVCYDEAGFGSGVNAMRFLTAGKPVIGFCHRDAARRGVNVASILQLAQEYPPLFSLHRYEGMDDVLRCVDDALARLADPGRSP